MIHPVILCGGSGTRLWPSSRASWPKQFVPLLDAESLYQATLRRFSGEGFAPPLVMTSDAFRFHATQQAQALGLTDARVVVEPAARDTAPAILAAALLYEGQGAQILISPSDHVVADMPALTAAIREAARVAADGALVTFGIPPTRAETGYGYLELAAPVVPEAFGTPVARPLSNFREKPDPETAHRFLASRRHLWNAGLFLFDADTVIAAFERHAPDLLQPCRDAVAGRRADLGFERLDAAAYGRARAISFDYAVMEKAAMGTAADVMAVPVECGWSDLGSWDALWQVVGPDAAGVATQGEVTAVDCRDTYLRSEEEGLRLVGLGLEGIVAVAMRDAVLVAAKDRAQDVKQVVATLRAAGVAQACDYPRFHRPWGWYETLTAGPRFQVKRIMVRPGGSLSLQSHLHRSEHWVVVEGTAEVTVGSDTRLVSENESVYIPLGARHRLSNPGRLAMYLIEVQTGAYLGEDDITRHEDAYGRE